MTCRDAVIFADRLVEMFPLGDGQRLVSVEICFHPNETVYAMLKVRVDNQTVEKMLSWFPESAGRFLKSNWVKNNLVLTQTCPWCSAKFVLQTTNVLEGFSIGQQGI